MTGLLPPLRNPGDREALRCDGHVLTYRELAGAASVLVERIGGARRVAVWATPTAHTCVAVVGALLAGATVVPLNPRSGEGELAHVVGDSAPEKVLSAPGVELPAALAELDVDEVDLAARSWTPFVEPEPESPALVVYTSGTTGAPKGVVLSHRAVSTNLDAVASAWDWTPDDVLVHALPMFHVHGLILGLLGPLRVGGTLYHLGHFDPISMAELLSGVGTMMFGVPTMYRRLADAAERDSTLARAIGGARLLVSGSAALPAVEHERIARSTGHRVVERYGMTETIMNCGVRADGDRRPGYVGRPFDGVDLRLVDEHGDDVERWDDETVGEILVRGPNLFTEYLNRPEATAEAFRDGWFRTGDIATLAPDGYVRIVGRSSTDLINSGGYKIGAGEIENALLEHPAVAEAAVAARPDDDLGERVVAWIVAADGVHVDADALSEHVARQLTPHKRPRTVHVVAELPRNELGKVRKTELRP